MNTFRHILRSTPIFRDKKKSAKIDFIIILMVVMICSLLSILVDIELVEAFHKFTRAHEDWDIDGWLLFILWLSLGTIIYAARRMRDMKVLNRHITQLAYYDPISRLPNRAVIFDYLDQMISSSTKKAPNVAVIFLDINNFKRINDTYGHAAGDELIFKFSERLSRFISSKDMISRLGGDEFICVLDLHQQPNYLITILNRIKESQKQPLGISHHTFLNVSCSIGVALYPEHGASASELIRAADMAMYNVKKNKGKAGYDIYTSLVDCSLIEKQQSELYPVAH